ncbi:MAG: hypothetical protein R3C10_09830 [Pirellulales bacterium]
MSNPYEAPLTTATATAKAQRAATEPRESIVEIARPIFLAWEKLRLVYVAVLGVLTVSMGMGRFGSLEFWSEVIVDAVAANVCYFAGTTFAVVLAFLVLIGQWTGGGF